MPTYHCDACGWEGTTPLPLEETMGDRLVWRVFLCPRCWAEVMEAPESPGARP